jgi:hypothetical protein
MNGSFSAYGPNRWRSKPTVHLWNSTSLFFMTDKMHDRMNSQFGQHQASERPNTRINNPMLGPGGGQGRQMLAAPIIRLASYDWRENPLQRREGPRDARAILASHVSPAARTSASRRPVEGPPPARCSPLTMASVLAHQARLHREPQRSTRPRAAMLAFSSSARAPPAPARATPPRPTARWQRRSPTATPHVAAVRHSRPTPSPVAPRGFLGGAGRRARYGFLAPAPEPSWSRPGRPGRPWRGDAACRTARARRRLAAVWPASAAAAYGGCGVCCADPACSLTAARVRRRA